jgi:bifunctional non-homologous end joining protein LigD
LAFIENGQAHLVSRAFDPLWLNGSDLRSLPLIERKKRLRKLINRKAYRLLYVAHLEGQGTGLFRAACKHDLEGIVAKWKLGAYLADQKRSRSR